MKTWYTTREASGLNHRGADIAQGKKILLSDDQATLHGSKVEKSEAPIDASEAGVAEEWQEYSYETKALNAEKISFDDGVVADGRGLARQSVAEVPSVEGTVEGGGFPHERPVQDKEPVVPQENKTAEGGERLTKRQTKQSELKTEE